MEQMKLFREAGVNPLGGCVPALLQIPIFFALYSFFNSNVALRGQSFLWADDLSQMLEKCTRSATSSEKGDSRDASLIGSRFFAKTRRSQDSGTDSASVVSAQRTNANTETILKIFVADGM